MPSDTIVEENETAQAVSEKLAKYTLNKSVSAGKFIDIDLPRGHATIECADGSHEIIDINTPAIFATGNANVGDYFVVSDDGTETWCSAVSFEASYTKAV
jgi:hypothetical protein